MSDGSAILLTAAGTLAGVVLGAVPSWYFSRRYYLKSGTDLDAALRPFAGNDQKLLQAVGCMLEQSGIGKPTYDAAGNLTGVVVTRTVSMSTDTFLVKPLPPQPPQYDRQHEQPPVPDPEADHA